ncbi:DUF4091 domain-containing protein [Paenibacillus sp. strain BS8-2]
METQSGFSIRCVSSLEKVFPDEELNAPAWNAASALQGEVFSLQVAYCADRLVKPLQCRITAGLTNEVTVRSVGLVPSELPCYTDHDDNVLRSKPGLYPDPLYPISEYQATGLPGQWRSFWLTVEIGENEPSGVYTINIQLCDSAGQVRGEEQFKLEIIDARLLPQTLIHTEWFHADCLATHYGAEPLSEEHWQWIERFVRTAAKHGINMILTPLFTPPLDTAVGAERPTVQLVDVERLATGEYVFSFDKLARWIEVCSAAGIRYFEFAHLFTQWGAGHAPKIMANTSQGITRIFGWDTDASGAEYGGFLAQLLPQLVSFVRKEGLADRCYFHVSDEPTAAHMESYRSAAAMVNEHLEGFPVIDALSDYSFYEQGLVRRPIPSADHIEPFLNGGVPDLWTYYCCAQSRDVTNRFFNMPSARNRILGMQLYKFQMAGFLHWGYNFWYKQYSAGAIDPFRVTDAGHAFPSGDAFLVYPGTNGPIESIRLEVLFEALQDLRALQSLESLVGREATIGLLEQDLEDEITFKRYPKDPEWLLATRERINRAIAEHPNR